MKSFIHSRLIKEGCQGLIRNTQNIPMQHYFFTASTLLPLLFQKKSIFSVSHHCALCSSPHPPVYKWWQLSFNIILLFYLFFHIISFCFKRFTTYSDSFVAVFYFYCALWKLSTTKMYNNNNLPMLSQKMEQVHKIF